jgi:hypothetical protein
MNLLGAGIGAKLFSFLVKTGFGPARPKNRVYATLRVKKHLFKTEPFGWKHNQKWRLAAFGHSIRYRKITLRTGIFMAFLSAVLTARISLAESSKNCSIGGEVPKKVLLMPVWHAGLLRLFQNELVAKLLRGRV